MAATPDEDEIAGADLTGRGDEFPAAFAGLDEAEALVEAPGAIVLFPDLDPDRRCRGDFGPPENPGEKLPADSLPQPIRIDVKPTDLDANLVLAGPNWT